MSWWTNEERPRPFIDTPTDMIDPQKLLDAFLSQREYFELYNGFLIVVLIVSLIAITFTAYIVLFYSGKVYQAYKTLLLLNLASFGSLVVFLTAFYRPYILIPFEIYLSVSPLHFSSLTTAYLFYISFCLIILAAVTICKLYVYNYVSICHREWFVSTNQRLFWIRSLLLTTPLIVGNFFLIRAGRDEDVDQKVENLILQQPSLSPLFHQYNAQLVSFEDSLFIKLLSLEVIGLSTIGGATMIFTTWKIERTISSRRTLLSLATYRSLRGLLHLMTSFCLMGGLLCAVPMTAMVAVSVLQFNFLARYPVMPFLFAPGFLSVCLLCALYLYTLSPYRRAVCSLFQSKSLCKKSKAPTPPKQTNIFTKHTGTMVRVE